MKAISYQHYGGPEALAFGEQPEPKIGPDSVLVNIRASSVNPVDWKVMAGYMDAATYAQFPVIPGWDLAGVVEAPGPSVPEFSAGDEVIGYVRMDTIGLGTFAEKVAAPVRTLARKPRNISWEQAGTIPLAGLTAYQSLVHALDVGAADTVLIGGGSGGVGSYAVQLAVSCGARVIATSSTANHEFLRGLGAEPTTYGPGLPDRIRELAPDGPDAYFDLFGGDDFRAVVPLVKDPQRIASIAETDATTLGGHYIFVRPDAADLLALTELVESGQIEPVVAEVYDLPDAAAAVERSMAGHVRGKISIRIP